MNMSEFAMIAELNFQRFTNQLDIKSPRKEIVMSNELNVEELVEDLTHVFGSERVLVIDENTDFSKLGNPFLEYSKKQPKKERSKMDRDFVAIEVKTKKRMDKHIKRMQKETGMKFTSISFLSSAVEERIKRDLESFKD
jgi:hypothetical protein